MRTWTGKLRIYEEIISAPLRPLPWTKNFQNLKEEIKEDHKKLREKFKEEIFHALPVQTRDFAIKSRFTPHSRERVHSPW